MIMQIIHATKYFVDFVDFLLCSNHIIKIVYSYCALLHDYCPMGVADALCCCR